MLISVDDVTISTTADGDLSIGDGGSANDPEKHAQNLSDLLGTVIRIDVSSEDAPYAIPPDNPCFRIWVRPLYQCYTYAHLFGILSRMHK